MRTKPRELIRTIKCTPAEAAGIIVHGRDRWKTLIGNASMAALGGATT